VDATSPALSPSGVPAVEGWFTTGDDPRLIGVRCTTCGTYAFPPRPGPCPNPDCDGDELTSVELSSRGTVWSYTENHYQPPPPFPQRETFEPYAIAAVELPAEGLVVLGQAAKGVSVADLRVGMPMKLGVDVLHTDDEGVDHLVWVWVPDTEEVA
jgi:uncharacterized protein